MIYDLDLDEIPFDPPPMGESAIYESEDEVWTVAPGEAEPLVEIMSAPLTRAVNAWTNRLNEEPSCPQPNEQISRPELTKRFGCWTFMATAR